MSLNENVFVKSMILNYKFFVLSDLESNFLRILNFLNKIFTTCQSLNLLFYNASDFEQFIYVHHMYFSHRFPPYNHVQLQAKISSSIR